MSPSRQTLLFSATLPSSLADFAQAGLNSPQLVQLNTERRISSHLGLAFFTCRCVQLRGMRGEVGVRAGGAMCRKVRGRLRLGSWESSREGRLVRE